MASALNPVDDPSRFVALRQLQVEGDEASRLLLPERTLSNKSVRGSHAIRMLLLEIFSGCGELSAALKAAGLGVGAPVDAYPAKNILLRNMIYSDLQLLNILELCLWRVVSSTSILVCHVRHSLVCSAGMVGREPWPIPKEIVCYSRRS